MIRNKLKLFILILIFAAASPIFSQERIVDNAGLLNASQKTSLTRLINSLSEKYSFDLVIVTEKSIGPVSPMDYADDFFDYGGYGNSGCLLLQVTDLRDYWISTSGKGINILNSYAFNILESYIVKNLSAGNNYEAYNVFLKYWEEFLELYYTYGRSYNFFHRNNVIILIVSWLIALAIGFIVVASWKSGMNTALLKTQASAYVVPGSLAFTVKKDNFLFSQVTKTRRQTDNNSSGGGRGIHTGSSGRSHGGGGGRY